MVTFISTSPETTLNLGEQWGREIETGCILGLTGEMGAGKTQLVKGIARGLGVTDRIHSPTFTLVNEYSGGRLPLHHLDLYRLETPREIFNAGLEEYLAQPGGVVVIEWIERWFGRFQNRETKARTFGSPFRQVRIEIVSETDRRISYEDFSP